MSRIIKFATIGIFAGLALAAAPVPLFAADLFPGYGSAISADSADVDGSMPQLLVSTPSLPATGAYVNFAIASKVGWI